MQKQKKKSPKMLLTNKWTNNIHRNTRHTAQIRTAKKTGIAVNKIVTKSRKEFSLEKKLLP